MVKACSALFCSERDTQKNRDSGLSFHKFPLNPERRNQWILACRRKNWKPSKWSVLCSIHFTEDMIDRTSVSIVRLRENAVPTIFPGFPPHLKKAINQRRSMLERKQRKTKKKANKLPTSNFTSTVDEVTDFNNELFSSGTTNLCIASISSSESTTSHSYRSSYGAVNNLDDTSLPLASTNFYVPSISSASDGYVNDLCDISSFAIVNAFWITPASLIAPKSSTENDNITDNSCDKRSFVSVLNGNTSSIMNTATNLCDSSETSTDIPDLNDTFLSPEAISLNTDLNDQSNFNLTNTSENKLIRYNNRLIRKYRRKIKVLQQVNRRQNEKILRLRNLSLELNAET